MKVGVRGRSGGRPRISEAVVSKAIGLYEEGNLSIADVCKVCEVSKSTFLRYLKQYRQLQGYDDTIDLDS